jgi:adenylylsulfate kinase
MSENVVWQNHVVNRELRATMKRQRPCLLWFTGLSGSGKSTIANLIEQKLAWLGSHTYLLDGDNIRHGLCRDLGFALADRTENIRRIGEVSRLMNDAGLMVLTAFISPFRSDRELVRDLLPAEEFIEVFVDAPLEECERRDPKGLYKKARAGTIRDFTGIDSPYEAPLHPAIHLKTHLHNAQACAEQVIAYLVRHGYITAEQERASA